MRKYIDCISVNDYHLALTIVEALEKDEDYSVDFYEQENHGCKGGPKVIELRVYHNEKVTPIPTMGFCEGEPKMEKTAKEETADA